FHDQTQINARDMWCSLDGPAPSRPYTPGAEHETEYAGDTGPTIGVMNTWGNPIDPATYDATVDPGLWYIPPGQSCSIPAVHSKLQARSYTSAQIGTITGSTTNYTEWRNRTAVMTGLAEWAPSGAGDASVNELTWKPYPSYRITWAWTDYLDWAADANSKLAMVHPQFRYRFGVKTYVDFLLDRVDNSSQTNLTMTPEEPVTAVKDAVQILVNTSGVSDIMALETFGSTGRHEVNLTADMQQVADTLYARQANHWDNNTNIGQGLQMAVDELTSTRARYGVPKIIVLMSDGATTTGPDPVTVAEEAASLDMKIYTVSVGYISDRDLMQQIATIGHGEEFYAAGAPEDYTQKLREIFQTIGGLRQAVLID
ncbi:MAG TPA: vWA domain-containing protein, partial [Phycisphaerae bacterium]|nr:vWA domain-containing protein [Phycisphaerae bacterium]